MTIQVGQLFKGPLQRPLNHFSGKDTNYHLNDSPINHHSAVYRLPLYFGGAAFKQVGLMSYNMENFFVSSKSKESIKALGQVIRKENPDIISAQEIGDTAALDVLNRQELSSAYTVFTPSLSNDARGIRNGFLFKKDIKLVSWEAINPKQANGSPTFSRDLLKGTFKITTPDGCEEEIIVLNAHYKAMVGGEKKTVAQRVREANATIAVVRQLVQKNPKANILLMGDLNFKNTTSYGQQVMKALLFKPELSDTALLTEIFGLDNPPPTHRFKNEDNKLDYIFVSEPLKRDVISAKVSGQFGVAPWAVASDHLPPVGVLKTRCVHVKFGLNFEKINPQIIQSQMLKSRLKESALTPAARAEVSPQWAGWA
jgi:endonuclease/exonuclease/phosphatase family metal-dependent hydrolase